MRILIPSLGQNSILDSDTEPTKANKMVSVTDKVIIEIEASLVIIRILKIKIGK